MIIDFGNVNRYAARGKEGVFEAVITTEFYFNSFGESNDTSTTTTEGTGVYFTQDSDGNLTSTDYTPSDE